MYMRLIGFRRALLCAAGITLSAAAAAANDIGPFQTVFNTDFRVAGVGGLRNTGTGTITLSGVSGPINKAYLYWHGPTNSANPLANANIFVNGNAVAGTNIGFSDNNCWGFQNSQAYRADVTSLITGDGAYVLTGLGAGTVNSNGASLVVFFNDGIPTNNRDVVIFDGNDSNINNPFDAPGWNVTLSGINYTTGSASLQMHVADGQTFVDDAIVVNASTLVPTGGIFDGATVPSANNGPGNNGSLWDIRTFPFTSFLVPGPNTFVMTSGAAGDCLSLIVAIVDLPTGAAPNQTVTLNPVSATNCTGTEHTVTATIKDDTGAVVVDKPVTFEITSGPHAGLTQSAQTDASGVATFSYTGVAAGTDQIQVCFMDANGVKQCADATKTWTICNAPPDTSQATPSVSCIWPPNHQFVPISILGVTDPDGDAVTIKILKVTSDEPTATALGAGGVTHAPDALGIGGSTAQLRAERSGLGDGRVYVVTFVADDGKGGSTFGSVSVMVPHDVRDNSCSAIDSGQLYNAGQ
jgi:hypothetical protein